MQKSFLFLASVGVAAADLSAELKPMPGYEGELEAHGTVTVTEGDGTMVTFAYDGHVMENNATGGMHIHAGRSCDEAGGHYWGPADSEDTWIPVKWVSDAAGMVASQVPVETGIAFADQEGHAVVIHSAGGLKIACGVLQTPVAHDDDEHDDDHGDEGEEEDSHDHGHGDEDAKTESGGHMVTCTATSLAALLIAAFLTM